MLSKTGYIVAITLQKIDDYPFGSIQFTTIIDTVKTINDNPKRILEAFCKKSDRVKYLSKEGWQILSWHHIEKSDI